MSKYLMRLTLFSLSISVLPTIFLGISAYAISSSSILDKVTKSNEQLLSQTEITIEQNIRIVDRTINQFTNLPIINSLNNMPLNVSGFQTIHDTNSILTSGN
ncbi:MAG: transcriptional regulator, AraC family [Paenibacillaceae bacterium]|nr:transcriptional regulator, AraC family [Paenibacillaceae bacterium]